MVRRVAGVRNRDRGQLMIVGAVTLAALLIGLVIVFNSALFTETVDQESAIQSSNDAVEFVTETERDVRSLTVRVNHARTYDSTAAVNASVQENVTNYDLVLSEAYADASATYVNVSYHADESVNGQRIVQSDDEPFTGPGGGSDWTLVGSPRSQVGWMVFNFNTTELSLFDEFSVRTTNATGEFHEVSFQRNDTGHVVVRTNVSADHAANGTASCRPVNGRLLVDTLGGEVYQRDCAFNGTASAIEPPYRVEFRNGDAAEGKYELVTKDASAVGGSIGDCPSPNTPCTSPAVWTVNATIVYRGSQVEFRKNSTVEVYGGTD